jgi:hypothetical protein
MLSRLELELALSIACLDVDVRLRIPADVVGIYFMGLNGLASVIGIRHIGNPVHVVKL